jgi:type IV secretory pathway VirB10-like protein
MEDLHADKEIAVDRMRVKRTPRRNLFSARLTVGSIGWMLALLLALSLGQSPAAPPPHRDVAVIDPTGRTSGTPRPALAELPDAELERRIAALKKENKRAFSDRRSLLIQELDAEKERRRGEREWEVEGKRREAESAAANAKLEAQYLAEQNRQRESDEAARSALAAARAAAEEEARVEAELQAADHRRTLLRWGALGALGLAAVAITLAVRRRR